VPELPPPPEPAPSLLTRVTAAAAARPQQAFLAVAGVGGAVLAVAVLAGSFRTAPPPEITLPQASSPASARPDTAAPPVSATEVVVHVAGAVVRPGVYRLAGGVRVADVIDEAGGPAGDADVHQLNLAAPVRDGDRIYVPRQGEAPSVAAPGASTEAPVDLNRATAAELDELPGVGPSTAQAIIAYREEHGPFRSVEQLLEVRGIGQAKLDGLRDLVRV
jgi:competence protein ComEA